VDEEVDLLADLNAEDDDGLGWSTLSGARQPTNVRSGAFLLAGNHYGRAVVRVVAVDGDGQVLGPRKPVIVPASNANERSVTAETSPKRLVNDSAVTTAVIRVADR